jgi:hypothetical protein
VVEHVVPDEHAVPAVLLGRDGEIDEEGRVGERSDIGKADGEAGHDVTLRMSGSCEPRHGRTSMRSARVAERSLDAVF